MAFYYYACEVPGLKPTVCLSPADPAANWVRSWPRSGSYGFRVTWHCVSPSGLWLPNIHFHYYLLFLQNQVPPFQSLLVSMGLKIEFHSLLYNLCVLINLCQCNFLHLNEILFQNEYMLKHMCFKNDFDLQRAF